MLREPRSGSKVWEALDRVIGEPGKNRGQVFTHEPGSASERI